VTQYPFAINCSLALADVPPRERAARARALGFDAVEFWWPFGSQDPEPGEIDEFVDDVTRAEVETVLLNFPGGGPSVGDRGLLCVPGREGDFLRSARTALEIGRRLGVRRFNPMTGNLPAGNAEEWRPGAAAFDTAVTNLLSIDALVGELGALIVLEPLSGFPQAAIRTFADARALVLAARAAGAKNVAILFDLYHSAVNADPVLDPWSVDVDLVGHVQVADAPGRGWPGTGELPLGRWIDALRNNGYAGRVGLECGGEPVPSESVALSAPTVSR
jgi:hydroxypyruvate isomerase